MVNPIQEIKKQSPTTLSQESRNHEQETPNQKRDPTRGTGNWKPVTEPSHQHPYAGNRKSLNINTEQQIVARDRTQKLETTFAETPPRNHLLPRTWTQVKKWGMVSLDNCRLKQHNTVPQKSRHGDSAGLQNSMITIRMLNYVSCTHCSQFPGAITL